MIELDLNDPICPSCGYPKMDSTGKDMTGHPLCFYCYHRGRHMMTKVFLLYVLAEQKNAVTLDELVVAMNEHPTVKGKKTFIRAGIEQIVKKATNEKNILILKTNRKKRNKGQPGRPMKEYRIGRRKGMPYLERYLEKWDKGEIVELRPSKFRQKFRKRAENRYKHLAIAKKIKEGEYGRFDFLFSRDLVKKDKVIDSNS